MTVPKRFGVLRFFGTLLKVLAWIVLLIAVLGAIVAVIASTALPGLQDTLGGLIPGVDIGLLGAAGGIAAGIGLILFGVIYFLLLYVAGENIHLQLAVEENTRLTAALLLKMHQEGQVDSTSGYSAGGGFVNEPYEN
jgi:hypothetical protein